MSNGDASEPRAIKLNEHVYVLPIATVRDGQTNLFNLSLLVDAAAGATLVDSGLPSHYEAINSALVAAGTTASALKRIILTHQDIDHVGALAALVQASGAQVLAHATEAPFIDGSATPRFALPAVLAQRPELRAVASGFQPTHIDELLQDDARLDIAGGVRVIFTPGHTPGHISLYLEQSRTLIAGDALTANAGQLNGPSPSATPDMAQAAQSIQKLAALDLQTIVCYHGGIVDADANGQIQRVAQELAA